MMKNKKKPASIQKLVKKNLGILEKSNRTFEEIYNIIFSQEGVMTETSTSVSDIIPYTFEQARRDIKKLSYAIYQKCGEGRFVALCCDNRKEWLTLFWAILRSGNKPYLVNLLQPESFTVSILNTLNIEHVICYKDPNSFGKNVILYDDLISTETETDFSPSFADEIAVTTSGTTLKEKICIYTGNEMTHQLLNTRDILARNVTISHCYNGNFKVLVMLPLFHIFGLIASYMWFAMFNCVLVFPHNLAPETLLRTIRFHEVTNVLSVPVLWHTIEKNLHRELAKRSDKEREQFRKALDISVKLQNISPKLGIWVASRLLKDIRSQLFGDSVYFCITGGGHIRSSAMELMNAIGYPLYNGYGMSEIGVTSLDTSRKPKDRVKASIGEPFDSVKYTVDDTGKLYINSPTICKKVIVDGVVTENNGNFDTGDIVTIENGRYFISGRCSDIVIGENGENLNPDIAEKAFDLPCAQNFSILGDESGEKLIMVVQFPYEITDEHITKTQEDINSGIAALPKSYIISKVWYTKDSLMDPDDIKISRTKLLEKISNREIKLLSTVKELKNAVRASHTKDVLRSILSENLDIPEEEILDHSHLMNDLGGTSLDYLTIVNEINERFGITLDYEGENFTYTLEDLSKAVEELIQR